MIYSLVLAVIAGLAAVIISVQADAAILEACQVIVNGNGEEEYYEDEEK